MAVHPEKVSVQDVDVSWENQEYIAKSLAQCDIRLNGILYKLFVANGLTERELDYFMKLDNTETNRARDLLQHVLQNKICTDTFLRVLIESSLDHLAKLINPDMTHDLTCRNGWMGNLQEVPYTMMSSVPSGSELFPKNQQTLRKPVTSYSFPSGLDSFVEAKERRPLKIAVVPSREIYGTSMDDPEYYKNSSIPRGLVFLANYKNFEDDHIERVGSEVDVKNLTLLFYNMGYKIEQHLNLKRYETSKKLETFRDRSDAKDVDSCIVIIMSHGHDEKSFYTSDGLSMNVQDVLDKFNNADCPNFRGKPKIFIFQYCRGRARDYGVENLTRDLANCSYNLTDSANFNTTCDVPVISTYSDMCIVFSTIEGYVSFRHPEYGSWLIEAICCVFMREACHVDLVELLRKVTQRIDENISDDGNKQICEYILRGFKKKFFFNPFVLPLQSSINAVQSLSGIMQCSSASPVPHYLSETVSRGRHFSGESNQFSVSSWSGEPKEMYELEKDPESDDDFEEDTPDSGIHFPEKSNWNPNADYKFKENMQTFSLWLKCHRAQRLKESKDEFSSGNSSSVCPRPSSYKRQCSVPSDQDALKSITSLLSYLKVNDNENSMLKEELESYFSELTAKSKNKRRKMKFYSQDL